MSAPLRDRPCAAAGIDAGEPLAGTAPHQRAWLLVEHPGPWGREPFTDAPWPDDLGRRLLADCEVAGVRAVAVRRHDARPLGGPPARPFVALVHAGRDGWAVSRHLDSVRQLLDLPLAGTAAGTRPDGVGWADAGRLWGVCTQGTRDTCCSRLGRLLAHGLTATDPPGTWETSHSGGHRFAPVLIAWPEGLVYGRVPAERLAEVTAARARGHAVLDLLRGRVDLPEPLQAAEIALRTRLGLAAVTAEQPDGEQPDGGAYLRTSWSAGGRRWTVGVRRVRLPDRPVSCGHPAEPAWAWHADEPDPL